MKFVVFAKFSPEDIEKIRAKGQEWVKELKQNPDKYPRYLRLQDGTGAGFGMIGQYKGITLLEADDEEQMQNTVSFFAPLMKFTYLPILQTAAAQQD
jgi:muconolactone delta-isomerase